MVILETIQPYRRRDRLEEEMIREAREVREARIRPKEVIERARVRGWWIHGVGMECHEEPIIT